MIMNVFEFENLIKAVWFVWKEKIMSKKGFCCVFVKEPAPHFRG